MQPPPDRLDALLAASQTRSLDPAERAELAGLLRECGRMDDAQALEAEVPPEAAAAPEPAPGEPAPPRSPASRPAEPLLPRWMLGVAVVGLVCVLAAVLVPWALARSAARSELLCRERLQRVSFALRLASDAAGGYCPPLGADLASLLAPYQIQPDDLRCPSGAAYRLNPMLAGQRWETMAALPSTALLVEMGADGTPTCPHQGRCLGVLTSGWVGELDSLAKGSLATRLPTAPEPAAPVSQPAWPGPAPKASPAPSPTPGPTPTAPPAPAPSGTRPSTIPPTQPERPNAGPTATTQRVAARRASEPQVLSGESTPPEAKAWQSVLTMEGHDLATSQPFAVGEQGRVRFETWTNKLGPQPFRLLLVDEVGARPLRVLADGVGPSKGVAEIGAEGRFRVRVISVQPYKVAVEDRR